MTSLHRTPLHPATTAAGARFTPFSGWEMAVQYGGIKEEHQAVRTGAGLFDISHMGKFVLRGTALRSRLQALVPTDLSALQPGQAQYTVLLTEAGGIVDDLIIYWQGEQAHGVDQAALIVNAATTQKDWDWLQAGLGDGVTLGDQSRDRVLLALQGPQSAIHLQALTALDLTTLPRFGHGPCPILGETAFVARTGYTGEDGFEIMASPDLGEKLWATLLANGVVPCGLGARDTLRLEAAMALYGQDITDQTTPLEAGLGWLVHLDRVPQFRGREVLVQQKQQGVSRRLVGLRMTGRAIARHGYPVFHGETAVGEVTSGTLSPTLGYPIALAWVPTPLSKIGQTLQVEIRGQHHPAQVVKRPFYRSTTP